MLIVAMIEDKMIQVLGHISFMLSNIYLHLIIQILHKGGQEDDEDNSNSKLGHG